MREKIGLLFLTFFSFSCVAYPIKTSSFISKSSYDYDLLGEGFGIIGREDIAINDCQATPRPFSIESTSYQYWQCFEVKQSRLYCDGKGYDESEKKWMTVMVISGIKEGSLHEYITRRAIPLTECQVFEQDWKRLVENEKYVCVSGSFNRKENSKGQWKSNWTFDRFKTKKGCESYFEGGCSLKYQIDQGCKTE
jgi:hypothetical protein